MTKQAQVGIFAILSLLLLFGIFYVITDFGTRHTGYRVGVHFDSAAGISSGALVYFSGVTVGSVDSIVLLPDNTVDVIMAIGSDISIPRASQFLIQAPLTGSPSLIIVPPKPIPGVVPPASAMLERQVLPIADQPHGRNPATLADLLDEGQGQIKKLDALLSDVKNREPRMMASLQNTMDNADALTATARTSLARLSAQTTLLASSLQQTLNSNTPKIDAILTQLDQMSISLNKSSQSLQQLAQNKELKGSLVETAINIAYTTKNIADLTADLRTMTGNPATQAQFRNTIANVDAASQRANSILGNFGGTSCVYGVDACGTPPPANGTSSEAIPAASPFPAEPFPKTHAQRSIKNALKGLVALQIRESGLSRQQACCLNPILSRDRGPQTDINAVLLANRGTSMLLGVNDLGYHNTWNAALLSRIAPNTRVGGGVLYGQLGLLAQYNARAFGLEGMLYDPRYAMLDLYGNYNVGSGLGLYLGERDTLHRERRTVYGVQMQF
jgi:phospholipid/cholesterol/gamma-HCH transport system substrate-binding protein